MRIAILTYCAATGATATVTRGLAVGFTEADVEVDVVYLAGPAPDDIHVYPEGVQLVQLAGRSRTCWPRLARYLRQRRPHALISRGWVLNPAAVVAVALARTRTRLILTEVSSLSYKTRVEHRHQPSLRILGVLARWLYPRADAVTGVSSPVIEDLEHEIGLLPRKVPLHVIPNPVDGHEVTRRALLADNDLVAAPEGPLFVNVARHARQKNVALLLRAFRRYLDEEGSGMLVLVGDGPEFEALRELATDLRLGPHVVFRGILENPFPQVAAATAFVLSSEEEGFGLVLVEAMTLGVPVVSTDCPGGPTELLRGGQAGLLVPPADERALAGAMRRVATEPELRSRLAAAGRTRAGEFSPSAIARVWLDAIDVIDRSGRPMDAARQVRA